MHFTWYIVLLGCTLASCSAPHTFTAKTYDVGGTPVRLVKHESEKPGPLYYNMHDDESTSVEAAQAIVGTQGGTLYELVHSGKRYIEFDLEGIHFEIDPNRIYTDTGIWRELDRTGTRHPDAFIIVKSFGQQLIQDMNIDAQPIVIALHNNSEGRYSLLSYVEGGTYELDAADTYRGKRKDPDDFYFITEEEYFRKLKDSKFHLVLQDNSRVTDDGSLSVYCGQRGIKYINVEAQHGHRGPQRKMIRRMLKLLKI